MIDVKTKKSDEEYLDFLRGKPCVFCGVPAVPHHYGMLAQGNGMATKCDDTYTAPICNRHHRLLHDGKLGSKAELFERLNKKRDEYLKLFFKRKEML